MATKTVGDIIGDLKAIYMEHFGVPHSNKAYQEQGKNIKALTTAVGYDNLIENFKYLLACNDPWLQNSKNIPGLIKWFDAIQTMRLNNTRSANFGSLSAVKRVQEQKEELRLAKYRKDMLDELYKDGSILQ